ncbi:MAG: magnesium chelatase subunit D family protein [Candidatus Freyarchaeota archaeon]|nr:magnesium chelatase subunit D family protein [Candidatus Jordarchaeia archaeon]
MPHHVRRILYPFTAIVDQEPMKKALILNAVNPKIGGVLIRGEKGTGKSTAVRGLAELLPEIEVVEGCPFNCNPRNPAEMCDNCFERFEEEKVLPSVKRKVRIVDLPLNATVDRVAGSLDIEKAIREGLSALEPGLLAEANRGILYVDEVNLLDDYVADVLLDAAASGVNVVEREGVSVSHPAKFILVGTMNPEEGELRPQLLDRFGLQVEVRSLDDPRLRAEVVRRVEEFENDPVAFAEKYKEKQEELKNRIARAMEILPKVTVSDELLLAVAGVCASLKTSSRAEITVVKAARTIAALEGRVSISERDVEEAMSLALPHRMRRHPFEQPHLEQQQIRELLEKAKESLGEAEEGNSGGGQPAGERVFEADPSYHLDFNLDEKSDCVAKSGRRLRVKSTDGRGVYVASTVPRGKPRDIALDATIRAAAARGRWNGEKLRVKPEDLREKVRFSRASALIVLVVDASGSMAALRRMEAAKGVALSLFRDAYINRDRVAFISVRGGKAQLVLPPTSNLDAAAGFLRRLPTGGKTPLSSAILQALELVKKEKISKREIKPLVVVITDGQANVPLDQRVGVRAELEKLSENLRRIGASTIVVDTRISPWKPSYIETIVRHAQARHVRLPDLNPDKIHAVIRSSLTR